MLSKKWNEVIGLNKEAGMSLDLAIRYLDVVIMELNDTIAKLEHSVGLKGDADCEED